MLIVGGLILGQVFAYSVWNVVSTESEITKAMVWEWNNKLEGVEYGNTYNISGKIINQTEDTEFPVVTLKDKYGNLNEDTYFTIEMSGCEKMQVGESITFPVLNGQELSVEGKVKVPNYMELKDKEEADKIGVEFELGKVSSSEYENRDGSCNPNLKKSN